MPGNFDLKQKDIDSFIENGFIKIEHAFPRDTADEALRILWADIKCRPDDPNTWTSPVIRLGDYAQEPFQRAANTPVLHSAFDQLVGKHNWIPRLSLGSFPVRFPCKVQPNDTGWHVEASFPSEDPGDFMSWRINVRSKGRGLLMLFIFSDITEKDAPTKIRRASHLTVAKILEPFGEQGLSFIELAGKLTVTENCKEITATGHAGTVYLCHPFLVHAAQPHLGTNPRFMAQPPLLLKKEFDLTGRNKNISPVEIAILKGLAQPTLS